jgi:hypothetical protein
MLGPRGSPLDSLGSGLRLKHAVTGLSRPMIGYELLGLFRQIWEAMLDTCTLLCVEPVKRLGKEIVANPHAA